MALLAQLIVIIVVDNVITIQLHVHAGDLLVTGHGRNKAWFLLLKNILFSGEKGI